MCLLRPEDGGSKILRKFGTQSHHYTVSQSRRPWIEGTRVFTSPWRWRQQGPPKLRYSTTSLYDVTTQKTMNWRDASVYFTLKMEAARSSETSVSYTSLYGATTQKTPTWIFIAVKTSNVAGRRCPKSGGNDKTEEIFGGTSIRCVGTCLVVECVYSTHMKLPLVD
jgi:hypothetical protein